MKIHTKSDNPFEEYCPNCGQYMGSENICPNCNTEVFNEEGLDEYEEGDLEDDPE